MAMFDDDFENNYAECTVCRTDTALLCSPCGDPVCHNCACPNGCQAALADAADRFVPSASLPLEAAA